jgi:hypothetical protein
MTTGTRADKPKNPVGWLDETIIKRLRLGGVASTRHLNREVLGTTEAFKLV